MEFKIDKKEILSLASTPDIFRRGVRYFEEGNIVSINYQDMDGEVVVDAKVMGNYREYDAKIRFDSSGVLLSYSCDCQAHIVWKGACKHVVCALMRIYDDNFKQGKRAHNNAKALKIITAFENRAFSDINNRVAALKTGDISLYPIIKKSNNRTLLGLSIGRSRPYIVKNISELSENVAREQFFYYGKDLEIKHSLNIFDEKSRALMELVLENYRFEQMGPKHLNLYGTFADKFFQNRGDGPVAAELDGIIHNLYFTEGWPPLSIDVYDDIETTSATAKYSDPLPFIVEGEKYFYFITESGIYTLEAGKGITLRLLLEELSGEREGIVFDGASFHGFMEYIRPVLAEMGLVKKADSCEQRPNLYFDMIQGAVEARVEYPKEGCCCFVSPAKYETEKYFEAWDFVKEGENLYMLRGDDEIFDFLESAFKGIKDVCNVYLTDSLKKKDGSRGVSLSVGVRLRGDLLEVSLDAGGYSFAQLLEAAENANIKKKYYRLKDGTFIKLSPEIHTFCQLSEEMSLRGNKTKANIKLPKYKGIILDEILAGKEASYRKETDFASFIENFKTAGAMESDPPSELREVLRPYQKTGFKWLKNLARFGLGGVLADDMGLGKTLQIIALMLSEKSKPPSLVVTPTSLIYNWHGEIEKFAPSLKPVVLGGTPQARKRAFDNSPDADVFIITYDALKRDTEYLADFHFNFVILDEAQNIKNPVTKAASTVKELKCQSRFALTGTPIENSLSELWSIFDFIMPGHLYGYSKFHKTYEQPIVRHEDENALSRLKKQIAPFILRRTKKEVLKELPEKQETMLFAELTDEQKKLYIANFLKAKGELDLFTSDNTLDKNRFRILSQLTRLRQICCHPSLFMEDYAGGSGKLELALSLVESSLSLNRRILVFSQFTAMLGILKKSLDPKGIEYYYLDGSTPPRKRAEMAANFNGGGAPVFLISLKAGGAGLNLTGADTVIHFDQWWNPAVMNQASDRAHRIGQENTVLVYNLIARDTVEEKIMELQQRKKDLTDRTIESYEYFLHHLGENEIKEIFT